MKNKSERRKYRLAAIGLCVLLAVSVLTGCNGPDKEQKSGTEADSSIPASAASLTYDNNLRISYIDVGQGDATFIELPDGKTILIDGGEAEYADTVIQYIEEEGLQTIDYMLATHAHSDHIGGLPKIIEHFQINAIYMPDMQTNTLIFENLLNAIKNKGLEIKEAKAGERLFESSGLSAEFLAPVSNSYADLNNYSAVLKLTYDTTSFLFMGDAEILSENEITADVQADVLKTGHHGSNYSTSDSFLHRVQPKYAVISCGVDNQYGHPDPATLDRLNAASIDIFRTDEMGTILIESDGTTISIDKKSSPKKENAPPSAPLPASQSIASTAPTPQPSDTRSQPSDGETTVYITNTGSKYHLDGCQYLRQSKIPISLAQARENYEPCSKCSPPR